MIRTAKGAGFCYGVTRAVELAINEAEKKDSRPLYTLGELIHNGGVNAELRKKGVLCAETPQEIPIGARVILRSHGAARETNERLCERSAEIIDATCPSVARIHRIVERETAAGKNMIIIGDASHPEVQGIAGWISGGAETIITDDPEDVKISEAHTEIPVAVVAQTTLNRTVWNLCVNSIKNHYTNAQIFDTICGATNERQIEAAGLAGECDAMVVIGDRHSSNTGKLAEICRSVCGKVLWIEDISELSGAYKVGYFNGCGNIGVTAGASVPLRKIEEVKDNMSEELNDAMTGEESFAELLEMSIKTLHTGERVIGTVTAVTPTEVQMDLGTKHAGFVPVGEMTDDPSVKIEDMVKPGDEIEVFVVKVNDAEGTVMLSKKKIDSIKGWENIENAADAKAVMDGIVVEDNKGGVLVSVNGVRVFVPASQTGLPRDAEMSSLLKKKVKVCIMEVTRGKRRVVGSIRAAAAEERKSAAAAVWDTIEVGKKYTGTVKSITDYGAFVDIGGVDGMVHLTELSWSRIKHPSDVVKIGDKIDVYVISFDAEKKKISLGHKDPNMNPWQQFSDKLDVGDVTEVRIVKLMPFGAFAEVVPGVDGLIHISQIADRRISRPAEVLEEGQVVRAKIIEVDEEHKKISLSMRAAAIADAEAENETENEAESDQSSED